MPTQADIEAQQQAATAQQPQYPMLSRMNNRSVASMALRERGLQDREVIAAQHFQVEAQKHELAKVHEMGELLKERQRISDAMEKQQQTIKATMALSKVNPNSPEWETNLLKAKAENPLGFDDPTIKEAVAHRYKMSQLQTTADTQLATHIATQQAATQELLNREKQMAPLRAQTVHDEEVARKHADLESKPDEQKAYQQALIGGKASGLVQDSTGKYMPAKAGTPATHFNVEYIDPKTGKPDEKVLSKGFYQQIKASGTVPDVPSVGAIVPPSSQSQPIADTQAVAPQQSAPVVKRLKFNPSTASLVPTE